MRYFVKHIASLESLNYVRSELERLGLHGVSVQVNEISADIDPSSSQYGTLQAVLQQAGIELFENKKDILVQRIKNLILDVIYHSKEPLAYNLSAYLTEHLDHDYTYMSNLFSSTQQITIERFYIYHKIERVKELLLFENMTVTDIAYRLHYSSLAHLSSQFKKITGLTTSQFKQQYGNGELPPEEC